MSTPVTYTGNIYNIPAYQDTGYAQGSGNLSSYLIALATGSLTLSGGSFPLTADADFGASFGLKSIYYKSRNANISTVGVVRLGSAEVIGFRNNAHGADLSLTTTTGDYLSFDGSGLVLTATSNQFVIGTTRTVTITAPTPASSSRTVTLPDLSANYSVVGTAGAQTIAGAKTFTSPVLIPDGLVGAPGLAFSGATNYGLYRNGVTIFISANGTNCMAWDATNVTAKQAVIIEPTTNQLILGVTRTVTITAPTPAVTSRVWTIPDITTDGTFASLTGTQTFTGAKTFSATLTMSGATIAMGSQKITGLAAASTSGDALRYEQLFGGDVTLIGNLIFSPTTKGIKGTTTNDSASAGNVGEVITGTQTTPTSFATSGQYGDLTTATFTAGEWIVYIFIDVTTNGATITDDRFGISSTTGNSSTGLTNGTTAGHFGSAIAGVGAVSASLPGIHLQLTGSTAYYLKYFASYSVATPQATGQLVGVRIR